MILMIFIGLIVFLLYRGQAYYYQKKWKENFEVCVEFSEEQASEGDELFLYETAVNNKKMQIPTICVKFQTSRYLQFVDVDSGTVSDHFYRNDIMSVDGYQKIRRKLRFTCQKRGLYSIEEAEIVSYDLFCAFMFAEKMEVNTTLCVYPSLIDVEQLIPIFRQMNGGITTRVPLFEDPYAFAGVREYTPQDSMRRIHWKASARMGTWQVKTTEYQASTPVVVALNLESPGVFTNTDLMEDSIRLAYSLVYYLCKNSVSVKLIASGNERIRMEGSGRNQIAAARRALAVISYDHPCCNGVELLHSLKSDIEPETHVILVSPAGKKPLQDAVSDMLSKGIAVTWVAPIISSNSADSEFQNVAPAVKRCLVKWGGI